MRRRSDEILHRESLDIQADYDAQIPRRFNRMQSRQSIEIQADYDAQIPPLSSKITPTIPKIKPITSLKARQNKNASPH
jgi:hypothetical protein